MPDHPTDYLNFNVNTQAPRYPAFDGRWRATECIGCPAAIIHRALGCPHAGITADTLSLFHEGYLHEDDMVARVQARGINLFRYGENGIRSLEIPIVAHPDGADLAAREIYEFKSIGDGDEFREFEQVLYDKHSNYNKQVQVYMRVTGYHSARVIMKIRKSGWILKPVVVPYDQAVTEPIWSAVKQTVQALLDADTYLAPELRTCDKISHFLTCSDDFMTRQFCPYHSVHCATDPNMASQHLNGLIADYLGWRSANAESTAEVKILRDKIYVEVMAMGVKHLESPLATISIYGVKEHNVHIPATESTMRIMPKRGAGNPTKELTHDGSQGELTSGST